MRYLLIILLVGCSTSKKIDSTVNTDVHKVNVDSLVNKKTDSVRKVYEEALKEMSAGVEFVINNNDSICREVERQLQNDVLNNKDKADSLLIALRNAVAPVNKVIVKPSGEMEYTGQIKSFNIKVSDLQRKLDSTKISRDTELKYKNYVIDSLRNEKVIVAKKTKVKGFGWFWFLVGFLGATFLWKRNQIISYLRK